MADFMVAIGLDVSTQPLTEPTFVPGIRIEQGRMIVDEAQLLYPGDLLHEGGHLATVTAAERRQLTFSTGSEQAQEMLADAWAWAALTELEIDPQVVFHPHGYHGSSAALIEAYRNAGGPGVPMLAYYRMTSSPNGPVHPDLPMFPKMAVWVRD